MILPNFLYVPRARRFEPSGATRIPSKHYEGPAFLRLAEPDR
jgi:hypothetical protein